ncbi:hypothetical protein [Bradyrhizobium sp. STM 3809]|uniref:hypothetical protein n=1 Tax=Bradyrhizobium sp. STM 3809 TaxID=551936 RepID=UPI0011122577|nr:hypothetical protein [Bradyrhizobium sp. STM 3809]
MPSPLIVHYCFEHCVMHLSTQAFVSHLFFSTQAATHALVDPQPSTQSSSSSINSIAVSFALKVIVNVLASKGQAIPAQRGYHRKLRSALP